MPDFQPLSQLVGRLPTSLNPQAAPGEIDKNGFMKLLIEQMRHQDPMNPMESTEYSAQLAQFSSLEQLQNLNSTSDQNFQANVMLAQSINNTLAATLVGKDVKAVGGQIGITDGVPGNISFELNDPSPKVRITVSDSAGNVVRTIETGQLAEGEQTVEWDGKDGHGDPLPDGKYTVDIASVDSDGNETAVAPIILGRVDAVRYEPSGAVLIVDGVRVGFGDVIELRDSGGSGGGLFAGLGL